MDEFRTHYDITADASRFNSALDSAANVAQMFGQNTQAADRNVRGFNSALGRFTGVRGMIKNLDALNSIGAITGDQFKQLSLILDELERKYANDEVALAGITRRRHELARAIGVETSARRGNNKSKEEELTLEQQLNAVGVRTTAQIEAQINQLARLSAAAREDKFAFQQLGLAQEELQEQLRRTNDASRGFAQSTKLSQFTLLNFGFAVQDASTFSQGFAFGLRSIANNIDGVVRSFGELRRQQGGVRNAFKQLGRDLTSPGGLLVIINLITTAAVVLFEVLDKRGKELDEIAKKSRNLTESLLELRTGLEGLQFTADIPQLEAAIAAGERLLAITRERREELDRSSQRRVVVFGGPSAPIDVRTASERRANAAALKEQEEREARIEETLKNQREILEDARLLREQANLLAEQGLATDATYEKLLEDVNKRLEEQQNIRRALLRLVEDEERAVVSLARQREIAAQAERERYRTGAEALVQAEKTLSVFEQLAKLRAGEAQTGADELARLERRVSLTEDGNKLLQDRALLSQRIATFAEEMRQIRERTNIDAKNAQLDERLRIVELNELLRIARSEEGERTAQIDLQVIRLERQLELVQLINRERISPRRAQINRDLEDADDVADEQNRTSPFRFAFELLQRQAQGFETLSLSSQSEAFALGDGLLMQVDDIVESLRRIPYTLDESLTTAFQRTGEESVKFMDQLDQAIKAFASGNGAALVDFLKPGLDAVNAIGQQTIGGFADLARATFEASGRESKKALRQYKALAIAEALINTFTAATAALRAGPIIGPVLAAGIVASGLAQVRKIRSIQAEGGGSGGGGGGGATSAFALRPGSVGDQGATSYEPVGDYLRRFNQDFVYGPIGAPLGGIEPSAVPNGGRVGLDLTITPRAMPNGDLAFAVEEAVRNNQEIGFKQQFRF